MTCDDSYHLSGTRCHCFTTPSPSQLLIILSCSIKYCSIEFLSNVVPIVYLCISITVWYHQFRMKLSITAVSTSREKSAETHQAKVFRHSSTQKGLPNKELMKPVITMARSARDTHLCRGLNHSLIQVNTTIEIQR